MKIKNIGIIGLDAFHAVAFTKIINAPDQVDTSGFRVTAAYPQGSKNLSYRKEKIPQYSLAAQELGVQLVASIEELLQNCDYIMLTSNDGHVHLEQAIPVLKARKPLFIDKPVAGTLQDAQMIFKLAQDYDTPVFSSSALRFHPQLQALTTSADPYVLGAHIHGPAPYEASLPDLLWYAIHGIEMMFTLMGTGCSTVKRYHHADYDYLVGQWNDGRIATFRGARKGSVPFGGTVFGSHNTYQLDDFSGYGPLVMEILRFFDTHQPPVQAAETLEIFAFIFAAEQTKNKPGLAIPLSLI